MSVTAADDPGRPAARAATTRRVSSVTPTPAVRTNVAANRYAAHVASRAGAMPEIPEALRQEMKGEP